MGDALMENRDALFVDACGRPCNRVGFAFTFAAAAYKLVRLPKRLAAARASRPKAARRLSTSQAHSVCGSKRKDAEAGSFFNSMLVPP